MEFEGFKHESRKREEDSQSLHSQQEEAVHLREIGERQLTEALEVIKTGCEQKATLCKELARYMTISGSVYNGSFSVSATTKPDNNNLIK